MEKTWWLLPIVSLLSLLLHPQSCESRKFHDALWSASASYVTNLHLHNSKMKLEDEWEKLAAAEVRKTAEIRSKLHDFELVKGKVEADENDVKLAEEIADYGETNSVKRMGEIVLQMRKGLTQVGEKKKKSYEELVKYLEERQTSYQHTQKQTSKLIAEAFGEPGLRDSFKSFRQLRHECETILKEESDEQKKITRELNALQEYPKADEKKGKEILDYLAKWADQERFEKVESKIKELENRQHYGQSLKKQIDDIRDEKARVEKSQESLQKLKELNPFKRQLFHRLNIQCEVLLTREVEEQMTIQGMLGEYTRLFDDLKVDEKALGDEWKKVNNYLAWEVKHERLEQVETTMKKMKKLNVVVGDEETGKKQGMFVEDLSKRKIALAKKREELAPLIQKASDDYWPDQALPRLSLRIQASQTKLEQMGTNRDKIVEGLDALEVDWNKGKQNEVKALLRSYYYAIKQFQTIVIYAKGQVEQIHKGLPKDRLEEKQHFFDSFSKSMNSWKPFLQDCIKFYTLQLKRLQKLTGRT